MAAFFWVTIVVAWVGIALSIANQDYIITAAISILSFLFTIAYGMYLKDQGKRT